MKKKNIVLLLIVFVLFVTVKGCDSAAGNSNASNGNNNNNSGTGNNNNGTDNNSGNQGFLALARIDIEDAHTVFIAPNPETSKDDLYKITDNGKVEEVAYYNTENDVYTETMTPSSIYVLNSKYFIISYKGETGNYLVNSDTGACYQYTNDFPFINSSGLDGTMSVFNLDNITSDNYGNIYFISKNTEQIKKLTVKDINNISISTVSVINDSVNRFGVDKLGNIAYEGIDSTKNSVLRYIKNNGGLEALPGRGSWGVLFWNDQNGNLYYYNSGLEEGSRIKELIAEPYTIKDYGDETFFFQTAAVKKLLRIKNKGSMILTSNAFSECYEIYNSIKNQPSIINCNTLFGLSSIKDAISSDDYYYLTGTTTGTPKNVLLRIDPSNNNYTTLLDGGYDIYKMTISPDNTITFNALRMSDGAIVIGEISATGQVRILDSKINAEVTVLERIR